MEEQGWAFEKEVLREIFKCKRKEEKVHVNVLTQ
jgi:hypothetical protein